MSLQCFSLLGWVQCALNSPRQPTYMKLESTAASLASASRLSVQTTAQSCTELHTCTSFTLPTLLNTPPHSTSKTIRNNTTAEPMGARSKRQKQ